MVDIVMPIYQINGERAKYFSLAVQSILGQTYKDWHLYMVDDCSPVDISGLLPHGKKITYVRLKSNRRLPHTLNTGHNMGVGEFCMWNCDDDWKEPEFLDEALRAIEGCHFVNCPEATFDEKMNLNYVKDPRKGKAELPKDLQLYPGFLGLGHLYRRSLWQAAGGYDERMFCIEDLDFWFRINMMGAKIGYMDKCFHNTIRHPESVTYDDSVITQEARQRFIEKWRKLLSESQES